MTTTSINNTVSNNSFSVNRNVAGTACVHSVTHSDNTNTSSHAVAKVQCGGTSGGDAFARLSVTGGQDYSIGVDNSAADGALLIKDDANPSSGNTLFKMTTAGERTLPKNSAFMAILANVTNVTGDSTVYTIPYTSSQRFNIGSNFGSNTTYTAPIDGVYIFTSATLASALNGSNSIQMHHQGTFDTTYWWGLQGGANIIDSSTTYTASKITFCYMDAGDTATTVAVVHGTTKKVDLYNPSFYGGALAC